MSWFNFLSKKRPAAQGFAPKNKGQELPQAFILEPILTPSGLLDGTDNPIDPVDIDISADQIADIDIPEIEEGFGDISDNDLEEIAFVTSIGTTPGPAFQALRLTPHREGLGSGQAEIAAA